MSERSSIERESVPPAWPALAALGVVGLMAVAMLVVDLVVARTTGTNTAYLVENSLRSIELAKDLRFQAHRLAEAKDSSDVATIATELGADVAEYDPLATEPGERDEFHRLQGLVPQLRSRSSPAVIDEIERSIAHLVEINERGAHDGATAIEATQQNMFIVDSADALIAIASAIGVAIVLVRVIRRQRELLRVHLASLAERHHDLEAFAARASHDLKAPLSPLRGYADLLHDNESPRVREFAKRIRGATDRMASIIDDLLALSVAGKPPPGTVAVAPMVLELVQDLRADLGDAEVVLELDDCVAGCSAGVVSQVLRNLLSNAIKFRSPDRKLVIRVGVHPVADRIELAVVDNGLGMDATTAEHAFEPFYRAPSASAPGHGLGLSIVKRAVEATGGSVALASKVGEGTSVTLRLPRAS